MGYYLLVTWAFPYLPLKRARVRLQACLGLKVLGCWVQALRLWGVRALTLEILWKMSLIAARASHLPLGLSLHTEDLEVLEMTKHPISGPTSTICTAEQMLALPENKWI